MLVGNLGVGSDYDPEDCDYNCFGVWANDLTKTYTKDHIVVGSRYYTRHNPMNHKARLEQNRLRYCEAISGAREMVHRRYLEFEDLVQALIPKEGERLEFDFDDDN